MAQVLKVLEGHTDFVSSVAMSTDGSKIVSGSNDNTMRIWSIESGQVRSLAGLLAAMMVVITFSKFSWSD